MLIEWDPARILEGACDCRKNPNCHLFHSKAAVLIPVTSQETDDAELAGYLCCAGILAGCLATLGAVSRYPAGARKHLSGTECQGSPACADLQGGTRA